MGTFTLQSIKVKKNKSWYAGKFVYDKNGNRKRTENSTGNESVTVTLEFTGEGNTSDFSEEEIAGIISKLIKELKK